MSDDIKFEGEFSDEFPPIPTEPSKETDLFFSKIFNQKFNEGVDACIVVVRNYNHSDDGLIKAIFNVILSDLEQLKKPINNE